MTALTAYLTSTTDTLLTTAKQITNTAPSTETSVTNKNGTHTGWGELLTLGGSGTWAAGASEQAPAGGGSLWDVTTLEGKRIAAGTWTPKVKLSGSATLTADIHVRAYKRSSGGVYTLIGEWSTGAVSITTTATVFSPTATSVALMDFTTGDKLYIDYHLNITVAASSSTSTVSLFENGGANTSVATPGYAFVLAGSAAGAVLVSGSASCTLPEQPVVGIAKVSGPFTTVTSNPAVVQNQPSGYLAGSGASVTNTFASNVTIGNRILLVQASFFGTSGPVANTPTSSPPLTWALLAIQSVNAVTSTLAISVWTAVVAATGTLQYTLSNPAGTASDYVDGIGIEVSNLDTSSNALCVDVISSGGTVQQAVASTSCSIGSTSGVLGPQELVLSCFATNGISGAPTVPSGFSTMFTGNSNNTFATTKVTASSREVESGSWTYPSSNTPGIAFAIVLQPVYGVLNSNYLNQGANGAVVVSGAAVDTDVSGGPTTWQATADGHVLVSGSAVQTETQVPTAAGNALVSGTATEALQETISANASVVVSGNATQSVVQTPVASGSALVSGSATDVETQTPVAIGSAFVSGTVAQTSTGVMSSSGNVLVSGNATETRVEVQSASGNVVVSGAATQVATQVSIASGNVIVSGASTQTAVDVTAAAGSVLVSGAANQTDTRAVTSTGASVISGTAVQTKVEVVSSSGNVVVSGSAVFSTLGATVANGVVLVSGNATGTVTQQLTSNGAVTVSGSSMVTQTEALIASGGSIVSGTAIQTAARATAASGSVLVTGNAAEIAILAPTATGNVLVSGSVVENAKLIVSSTGNVIVSGNVTSGGVQVNADGVVKISGAAAQIEQQVISTTGSAVTSGLAAQTTVEATVASGSVIVSGSATETVRDVLTSNGGVIASGSVTQTSTDTATASGTPLASGNVLATLLKNVAASGIVVVSGTAIDSSTTSVTADGSVVISGVAALVLLQTLQAQGNVVLSGSALAALAIALATNGFVVVSGSVFSESAAYGALRIGLAIPLQRFGYAVPTRLGIVNANFRQGFAKILRRGGATPLVSSIGLEEDGDELTDADGSTLLEVEGSRVGRVQV